MRFVVGRNKREYSSIYLSVQHVRRWGGQCWCSGVLVFWEHQNTDCSWSQAMPRASMGTYDEGLDSHLETLTRNPNLIAEVWQIWCTS